MSTKRARSLGPRAPEPSDLRQRILQASVELIEDEGLAKLSMREVARRAGVTHQAPYHYFADREAILGEIAEQGFRLLTEHVERDVIRTEHRSVAQRISALARTYVDFACAHPAHFRIMFRPELVNMDRCPGADAQGDIAFSTVTRVVHEAVQAGLPAVPSEAALVAMLWSFAHGLACLVLDGPLAKKQELIEPGFKASEVIAALQALLERTVQPPVAATSRASKQR
ncbi:MAG TPA: TetR/AcrR family transcriptional regulator [Polyangiales bacterium]|jgi:AcrR family transcriptional regulator